MGLYRTKCNSEVFCFISLLVKTRDQTQPGFFLSCFGGREGLNPRKESAYTPRQTLFLTIHSSESKWQPFRMKELCTSQIEGSTSPPASPLGNPRAFEFLENFWKILPFTGPKSCSNAPTPGKINRLGTGQKVQGGEGGVWAGAFWNVVVRKHMTHPFQLEQNGVTHP